MNYIDYMETPIGTLQICSSDKGVTQVVFTENVEQSPHVHHLTDECKHQLTEYFSGNRQQFDLPLDSIGTAFQQSVWRALLTIPYGALASYQDIANHVQNPKAVRAVGAANGKNPIGIIVPCHRVIGSDGSLTGYAGGLERKQWLLQHESKQ